MAIIESKNNVHKSDIDNLLDQKIADFKKLFPKYSKHSIYLAMAGFSFEKGLQECAQELGIAVIRLKRDCASKRKED